MNKEERKTLCKDEFNNYKTIMKIGNMTIYQEKHFNWFNKLMFKLVFNIEIADYKGDE